MRFSILSTITTIIILLVLVVLALVLLVSGVQYIVAGAYVIGTMALALAAAFLYVVVALRDCIV